jgi:hypothetical protein
LQAQSPGTPFARDMEESEALFSNVKIKQLLDFVEKHPWRTYSKLGEEGCYVKHEE